MAVTDQVPRNVSIAAPGATVFPYSFKSAAGDLLVQVDGVTKLETVDYTVTGAGLDAGGNVTLLVPLVGGETVLRKRQMAYERSTDFQNLGDLRSATLNNDQDAAVMMAQQLADDYGRAVRVSPNTPTAFNAEVAGILAPLSPLVINAAGDGIAVGDTLLTGDMLLRGSLAAEGSAGWGGALVGFRALGAGATARTLYAKLLDNPVSPLDYGGVGDGVTNDAPALNAAIAYLNSIGWSRPLSLGSKQWRVDSALTIINGLNSPTVVGDGAQVIVGHAAGDVFTFYSGGGGTAILNAKVSGIEFTAAVTRTSGAAVRGLNVNDMRVESCTFRDQYEGIKVGVYQYPTIHDCTFLECKRGVELAQGSGGTISNVRAQTGSGTTPTVGTIGVLLTNASGVMMTNCDLVRCEAGIYGQPAAGAGVQFLFLVNVLCDTCTYGLQLSTTNGGVVSSIFASNSWFSSCHENGVYALGVKNLRLVDCEVIVNKRDGVNLISCEQVRISGGMCGWNNTNNAAEGAGVAASGVAGLTVRKVLFTNKAGWVSYGATSNQKYGIALAGVACSDVTIEQNSMVDHTTGDVRVAVAVTGMSKVSGNRTSRSNTIASAANIAVEVCHDDYEITGTTVIQNIGNPPFKGQMIRLRTLEACTINDGFNFKLAGNFVGTANSTLTLQAVPGTGWVEVGRAIV